jgi:hypothetical protein
MSYRTAALLSVAAVATWVVLASPPREAPPVAAAPAPAAAATIAESVLEASRGGRDSEDREPAREPPAPSAARGSAERL